MASASDSFDRANAATLGANWSNRAGGDTSYSISTNQLGIGLNQDTASFWGPTTFAADHFSQIALTGLSGTSAETGLGVCVRCNPTNLGGGPTQNTYYQAVVNTAATNNVSIAKFVGNTYTLLGQRTQAWANGDILRLEAQGTTLRVYRNGVQLGASITDASIATGQPGVAHIATFATGFGNDWSAGDLTVTTTPGAPQTLTAIAGNAQVALSWSAPASNGGSAILDYQIYRGTAPDGETQIAGPAGTGTTYTDTTAVNGTLYYYRVSARNAVGFGPWGNEVSATPSSGATAPTAPLSLLATSGNAQNVLTWNAPASNGGSAITGYKVYRGTSSGTEVLLAPSATFYPADTLFPSDTAPGGLGTGTTYTDSTAVNGTNYCYKVSALNAVGESALSNESCATPSAGATLPSAPLGLAATPSDSQVSLTWSAPSSDGGSAITAYRIYRSTTSGAETLLASPAGTGTAYTDSTAVNGTTYYYKVLAVNANGAGPLSSEASATPAPPVSVPTRTYKRLYGPTLLSNAAATLYTVPALTTTVIRHVHVSNPTGSPVNFSLSIGTSAAGTRLWDATPIPAGDVLDHYQDFTLAAGEIIQGFAGTDAVLNLTLDGYELFAP